MARLIEVQAVQDLPPGLTVRVGDLLLFRATGGRLRSGGAVLEALGAFMAATPVADGSILSAMGSPDAVLFLAREPGQARIEVMTGDPFHGPGATRLEITVEP